ncbi:hypothetical protein K466DRAFT_551065 [Polyporus arcularius HHB13444]|uniref:Mini-chromosome maintenance replisome factor-domain-containing protein n=1 Tax=Polyporus arcularius HHB13444 TaxID=1314778 RepID=A0A5C3PAV3_9APHY|nr:hypothetical protein K466DRAFT_551065 [Polyporus arcularius HHB13444]
MTADYQARALHDPSTLVQELFRTCATTENFPRLVAEHFSRLFERPASFKKIPILNVRSPPQSHQDRALVRFRAMVQDTSLSTEMYLSTHHDGSCGGWGMYEAEAGSSSNASQVDYASLQECNVLWATSLPAESDWCADELDGLEPDQQLTADAAPSVPPVAQRSYKFPHSDRGHVGLQVKVYDKNEVDTFKSTDVVTFVGIITTEPCGLEHTQETASEVPTLHVLFTKSHTPNLLPRPFPRLSRPAGKDHHDSILGETANPVAQDTADTRRELISWIAEEALAEDLQAAEWVLLSCIARVQSRHPPLLPPSLVVSRFPAPPPVPSTVESPAPPVPTLSAVLGSLLPLTHTLNLSLEGLNKARYTPESKDEDLHAGVLQLPQGTVLLVSEGGVREGQLQERGIMNVRALQEVMDAQTLAYVFPFSQFSFPTDISCIILAEGRKSAFFRPELGIPLRAPTDPAAIAALYKPADQIKMPSRDKLASFRDLVVGARCGKVQVPEATSEHIQSQFVLERQGNRSVTADDLIRWMTVSKLYALSLHEPALSVETWQRAKALDDQRRALLI